MPDFLSTGSQTTYDRYGRKHPYVKPEKKHRDYWYLAFGLLFAATAEVLDGHILGLVNGSLTISQFGANSLATLSHAHATGYSQGANSVGGDMTPAEAQEYTRAVMIDQAIFLNGFLNQLEDKDPRYVKTLEELYSDLGTEEEIMARVKDGSVMPPAHIEDSGSEYYDEHALQQRMRLYNERVRGTANWGAVEMLAPWEEIHWVLGDNEDHCQDCPRIARKTYRKDTLPGVPGSGFTECLVWCRCELQLDDGTVIQF